MTRRANGEGTIYQRKDGRWAATVSLGNGSRKSLYAKTRAQVAAKLTAALSAHQGGTLRGDERLTVAEHLTNWLAAIGPTLRATTRQRYEAVVRQHLIPALGQHRLTRLTAQHLQRLYAEKLTEGQAPGTVRYFHAVISAALTQAERHDLVPRNVARLTTPPKPTHHEMTTLGPEEARRFLDAAEGDRLEALFTLALTTGARQGELLGLPWRNVDLDRGTLQVRVALQHVHGKPILSEPKTAGSRRQIVLTSAAVAALRRHRAAQAEERLRLGGAWADNDLVFPNETGAPLTVSRLIKGHFRPVLRRADVPAIRFHDLRHTAATLLLADGTHPKIVSEMLGHCQISITLDLYSHVTPTMQRQAADSMDAILGGGR